MPKYSVDLPISGYVTVEVEAESEEEAIQKALEADIKLPDNLGEWEVHEQIIQGNVCHAIKWEAEAIKISDNDLDDIEDV